MRRSLQRTIMPFNCPLMGYSSPKNDAHTDTRNRVHIPEPLGDFSEYAPTGKPWYAPQVPKPRPILRDGDAVTGMGRRKRAVANVRLDTEIEVQSIACLCSRRSLTTIGVFAGLSKGFDEARRWKDIHKWKTLDVLLQGRACAQ